MKLTKWYPADVKPINVGIYEIKAPFQKKSYFSYFDGNQWGYRMNTTIEAVWFKDEKIDIDQISKWRGLAKKP